MTTSPLFAYRVMQKVQVFEPWHVAALDSVRRFIPRSRSAQVLAGAVGAFVAMVVTAVTVFVLTRIDAVAFVANVVTERVRTAVVGSAATLVSTTIGEGAASVVRGSGTSGMVVALTAFLLTVVVAAFGLRAVATASRRRRT
jgi:hypothetical protein